MPLEVGSRLSSTLGMPCYEQLKDWNQSGKCETDSNTRLKKIKLTLLLEFIENTQSHWNQLQSHSITELAVSKIYKAHCRYKIFLAIHI